MTAPDVPDGHAEDAPAPVQVALLGCGVVGTEVVRLLTTQAEDLAARCGAPLEIVGIAVRDVDAPRDPVVDPALLTTDAEGLVDRADVVVEVMGGVEPARTLLLRALERGTAVVTANKALLGEDGPTLYAAADAVGADLYFEAAVAGAIPLVRPVRESLAGDRITRVLGIVNGTTNYVLDQMTTTGAGLDEALARAQELGYAEADPTADVEGHDAAAKAAILASLAFHTRVGLDDVHCEGIMSVTADDVAWARESGHVVKLLAIAERSRDGERGQDGVVVRVHPALVPDAHPLASVRGAFNAVFVEAEAAGELMFYGRGAGGLPTASAVLGDLVTVARHRVRGGKGPVESRYAELPVRPIGAATTRYQVRLRVVDRPGVLAQVSSVFAEQRVSIETVRQAGVTPAAPEPAPGHADLLVVTHAASDASLAATVRAVGELPVVERVLSVLRVEGV